MTGAKPPRDGAKPAAPVKAVRAHGGSGEVRIIGGRWKRTPLPVAALPGLRPTPQRVRETLFNWLGQDLAGWRCVDAFAGSGALGFEAASRGAAAVLLCEHDTQLAAALRSAAARLDGAEGVITVRRGDGVAALREAAAGSLDLVLLDPPFDAEALIAPALQAAAQALAPDGFVYLEAGDVWNAAALAPYGLGPHRYARAGAVHAHLLIPADE